MNRNFLLILLLFFFSGASALVYEVLWLKELGLLFGNASYAMATTLAAFFLGLAVGGYHWGNRVHAYNNHLKLYGILELCLAVCALGYFIILKGFALIYPHIFDLFGNNRVLFTTVKFGLALLILFPPAYFMGGTLPVISHFAVRQVNQLGHKVSLLYSVNTLGAVAGVFLAGFILPPILGFNNSYLLAMAITALIAVIAIFISKEQPLQSLIARKAINDAPEGFLQLKFLAFLSGMAMLALQVLWGRMFAQVLQNSVYTFSVILMIFLFSMAIGGILANRLMRLRLDPNLTLFVLLMAGALLVAITPFEFIWLTDNLHYIGSNEGWHDYIIQVMLKALVIMGPPLILLGSIFPFMIKLSEQENLITGKTVGQLAAINTAGAIAGSLLAGFIILDFIGLWSGIRLIAMIYILAAWLWLGRSRYDRSYAVYIPAVTILLLVSILDTAKLPIVRVDPVIDEESLLQAWEGSAGTVAVIRRGKYLKIKVNNFYTLGGTGSYELEQFQGHLPIMLHEKPKNVYVLGLGTGITAGATLSFPVEKLVVTELIPEVVDASDTYFGRYNNSLFYDPRVRIIDEDGRNYLRGTSESFDVIISDLFVPWKAGTGNLYSLEHYQSVFNRLNEQGLFIQWLPAYQLSNSELAIIIRTMLDVFPQLTVWRGDFSALRPIIGIVANKTKTPLSRQAGIFKKEEENKDRVPLLAHYVGSLEPVREQFSEVSANTDDQPIIEFLSPITQRQIKAEQQNWLAGEQLIAFMDTLQTQDNGWYLSELDPYLRKLPAAGYHLHFAQLLRQQGKLTKAKQEMQLYTDIISARE